MTIAGPVFEWLGLSIYIRVPVCIYIYIHIEAIKNLWNDIGNYYCKASMLIPLFWEGFYVCLWGSASGLSGVVRVL